MTRLQYRLYRMVSGLKHWLPRRFTPAGLLAVGFFLLAASIGLDMDQTVAYQGVAGILSLLLVAAASGCFFRGNFHIRRELPRFGTVDQPLTYRFHIESLNPAQYRDLEWFEDLEDPRPSFEEFQGLRRGRGTVTFWASLRLNWSLRWKDRIASPEYLYIGMRPHPRVAPVAIPNIPSRGRFGGNAEIVPTRRGPLRFRGATLARRDPLGLWRSWLRFPLAQSVLVLPKRYRLPDLALPGTKAYQHGGVSLAASIGESDEFTSLRDYRPGDPLRHIHWRSWARAGRPIVKEFQDEYFVRHALILDTLPPDSAEGEAPSSRTWPDFETIQAFEEAVSVAASFACGLDTQESLLDLMFVGPKAVCLTMGRGVGQVELGLEYLAVATLQSDSTFAALEALVLRHGDALCGCICVLLHWDRAREKFIQRLESMRLPLLILVVSKNAPSMRPTALTVGGTTVHFLDPSRIGEDLQKVSARP